MRECCPLIRNVTKPYLILLIMGDFNYSNHDMAIFHLLHSYVALCTFTHGCGPVGPTKSYHIRFSEMSSKNHKTTLLRQNYDEIFLRTQFYKKSPIRILNRGAEYLQSLHQFLPNQIECFNH